MQRKATTVTNRADEFTLTTGFDKGYRAREDVTLLPPGILVHGSQNVLTNTSERIAIRKGFTLDGQADATITPITSAFDWTKLSNNDRHMRSYSTKIQFRYVHPISGAIIWTDLASGFANSNFNYTNFWDTLELTNVLLFVNGTPNIFEWSGGVASFQSATANTITKSGTTTWAEEGFYSNGTRNVIIGGIVYNYTGGEGTTTLTGVTPDPTLGGHAVGDAVFQEIRTTANAAMTAIDPNFKNDLIGNLLNQIFIASKSSFYLYVSQLSNYKDYSFSSPRLPGEGALITMGGYATCLINQEGDMYVSAGQDLWYRTEYVTTTVPDGAGNAIVFQDLNLNQLKTTVLQATQSQALTTKIKNNIAYVSFEPIVNYLGRVENIFLTPQIEDISFPIINDINSYNFTDGAIVYFRQFLYFSVPTQGIVRVYNMTNPKNPYWEAPLTLPIARFSIIDDSLYGHSYAVPETYKLFDGYNDNGADIDAIAVFSYNNYGIRSYRKNSTKFYVEG